VLPSSALFTADPLPLVGSKVEKVFVGQMFFFRIIKEN